MKKSKQEAERDILAKNHRRLNKAIDDLLNENKALRKRLDASTKELNEMRVSIQRKFDSDRVALIHTVVHALAPTQMQSERIAERAVFIADEVQKKVNSDA